MKWGVGHWGRGETAPFMGANCILLTKIGLEADFSLSSGIAEVTTYAVTA